MVVFSKLAPAFSSLAKKHTGFYKGFPKLSPTPFKDQHQHPIRVDTCNRISKVIIGQQQRTFSSALFNTTNNNNTPPSSSPSEPLDELKQSVLTDDGVNDTKLFTLSVVQFEEWSKDQTASILCAPKNQGGAGLTPDDVKPLYDAGFKGSVLGNIVVNINKYDEEKALSRLKTALKDGGIAITPELANTLESVVNWVNNQLMPKLYHLWSVDQVKEQLCKPIDEGGAGLSVDDVKPLFDAGFKGNVLASIVENIKKKDEYFAIDQLERIYNKSGVTELSKICKTVVFWVNNQLMQKFTVPMIKVQRFIGKVSEFMGDIPYQNNKSNVLNVGNVILSNINSKKNKSNERFQSLIINFAYYGFGKTRFGVEFLDLWKKYLEQNAEEKKSLILNYGEETLNQLMNTELIYVDLSKKEPSKSTLEFLINMVPNNQTSYLIVLDEYPAFCEKNLTNSSLLYEMYRIWNECILTIQQIPNVVGVYVCGKGAFIDLFGKPGIRKNGYSRSPTAVYRSELHSLSRDNLNSIFQQIIPNVKAILENAGIYETCLDEILEETGGIPILINIVIDLFKQIRPKSMEQVGAIFDGMEKKVPPRILYPFAGEQDFSYQIYIFLMFISQMIPKLDSKKLFNTQMLNLSKIKGLEDVEEVDLSTLAVALNCYVAAENDQYVRLVFPRRTIRKYSISYGTPFSIVPFVRTIPQFIDKGSIFETLMGSYIVWKAKIGFWEKLTFSNVFPFFTNTPLENKLCVDLNGAQTNTNITKNNASTEWKTVYSKFGDYKNKMNFMNSSSFGPEKFIVLEQDLWWCIQDKNTTKFDFSELGVEIENLKVFPSSVQIIFTIFYRCEVNLEFKVYSGGSNIRRPVVLHSGRTSTNNEIAVPSNVTVIIVDKTGVSNIIGEDNYSALVELSQTKPGVQNL